MKNIKALQNPNAFMNDQMDFLISGFFSHAVKKPFLWTREVV